MVGSHIFLNVTINNFRIEKEFILCLQEVSMFRVMKDAFFCNWVVKLKLNKPWICCSEWIQLNGSVRDLYSCQIDDNGPSKPLAHLTKGPLPSLNTIEIKSVKIKKTLKNHLWQFIVLYIVYYTIYIIGQIYSTEIGKIPQKKASPQLVQCILDNSHCL